MSVMKGDPVEILLNLAHWGVRGGCQLEWLRILFLFIALVTIFCFSLDWDHALYASPLLVTSCINYQLGLTMGGMHFRWRGGVTSLVVCLVLLWL